jgi:hypothetical protein
MTKALSVLSGLLFPPFWVAAQSTAGPPQPANEPNPSTQIFIWNEKRDLDKWIRENKSSLDRGDACTLKVSYSTSGVFPIASFVAVPVEEEITRIIHDSATDSGLDIRVGVSYPHHDVSSGTELEIALAFEGSPNDVFYEINGAQAWTLRDRSWKFLRVEKRIDVGDLRYRFFLECVNGKLFMDFARPAKHKSHSNHRSSAGQLRGSSR